MITSLQAKDIIITAVEGGIGYWADVIDYSPSAGTVTVLELNESGSVYATHKLTWVNVQKRFAEFKEYAKNNLSVLVDLDDVDAELADCIIQFTLLNEVRYS